MSALLVGGVATLIGVRSYNRAVAEFFPERRPVALSPDAAGLPSAESVSFQDAASATLRGWYVKSRNSAAVVLVHGAGGDRTSLAPEGRVLAASGFGVLTFDLPGHGESDGEIRWSDGESRAVRAAVDFLTTQSDVDPQRIGALGFSMGGVVLARVVAADPRLSAAIFVGTPSNQPDQVGYEYRQWGPLSQWPALWALSRRGMPLDRDQARDLIGSIAPRPVLIVTSTSDTTVPESIAQDLFAHAQDPKQLLVIEGGSHGAYDQAPNSPYLHRVADFFTTSLRGLNRN